MSKQIKFNREQSPFYSPNPSNSDNDDNSDYSDIVNDDESYDSDYSSESYDSKSSTDSAEPNDKLKRNKKDESDDYDSNNSKSSENDDSDNPDDSSYSSDSEYSDESDDDETEEYSEDFDEIFDDDQIDDFKDAHRYVFHADEVDLSDDMEDIELYKNAFKVCFCKYNNKVKFLNEMCELLEQLKEKKSDFEEQDRINKQQLRLSLERIHSLEQEVENEKRQKEVMKQKCIEMNQIMTSVLIDQKLSNQQQFQLNQQDEERKMIESHQLFSEKEMEIAQSKKTIEDQKVEIGSLKSDLARIDLDKALLEEQVVEKEKENNEMKKQLEEMKLSFEKQLQHLSKKNENMQEQITRSNKERLIRDLNNQRMLRERIKESENDLKGILSKAPKKEMVGLNLSIHDTTDDKIKLNESNERKENDSPNSLIPTVKSGRLNKAIVVNKTPRSKLLGKSESLDRLVKMSANDFVSPRMPYSINLMKNSGGKKEKKEESNIPNLYLLEKNQLYIHGVTKLKESQLIIKDGHKTEGLEMKHKKLNEMVDDMSIQRRKKNMRGSPGLGSSRPSTRNIDMKKIYKTDDTILFFEATPNDFYMIKAMKHIDTKEQHEQGKESKRIKQLIRFSCREDEFEIIFDNMTDERNIIVSDEFIAYENNEELFIRRFIDDSLIKLKVHNFGRFIKTQDKNLYWVTSESNDIISYNLSANTTTNITNINEQTGENNQSIIEQIKQFSTSNNNNQMHLNEYCVGRKAIIIDKKLYSLQSGTIECYDLEQHKVIFKSQSESIIHFLYLNDTFWSIECPKQNTFILTNLTLTLNENTLLQFNKTPITFEPKRMKKFGNGFCIICEHCYILYDHLGNTLENSMIFDKRLNNMTLYNVDKYSKCQLCLMMNSNKIYKIESEIMKHGFKKVETGKCCLCHNERKEDDEYVECSNCNECYHEHCLNASLQKFVPCCSKFMKK